MSSRQSVQTRRESAYEWVRYRLPPTGETRVNLRGVGVLFAGVGLLLSAVVAVLGRPDLITILYGLLVPLYVLYVFFHHVGGI